MMEISEDKRAMPPARGVDELEHSPARLAAAAAAAAALLAACGGGGGGGSGESSGGVASSAPSVSDGSASALGASVAGYAYVTPQSDEEAARFLLQAQFNASTADIAAVRGQGFRPWLSKQLDVSGGQTGVQWLDSRGYNNRDGNHYYDHSYPADFMVWQQLMKAPDGVRKRVALALSEFFVVSLASLDFEFRSHGAAQYWDLLNKGAQGNYRTLLEDMTLNPAMGAFLNTRGNQKEDNQGRQPDENYSREVMQLFTIGLYQLNLDGTEKRAADGSKLPSYTLADVTNLARVFTGWDFDTSQNSRVNIDGRDIGNTTPATRPMVLNASRHSTLAATFLGTTIAANTDGAAALRTALDTLFNHPNVGPFFGKQMIQRLVTSNPSPAYVARVAAVFNNNGAGVRGDMKSVFAAILLDDEARGPAGLANTTFGKLREPMVRFVQWGRTFGLNSAANSWKLDSQGQAVDQLGQSPLRPASVFSFFRPGYVPPSTALATAQKVAPEFQIVNESSVGGYLNYMQERIRYGFYIDSPDVAQHTYNSYVPDISASYAGELPLAADAAALVNRLNLLMCAGQLPPATVTLMVTALNATPVTAGSSNDTKLNRICAAVLMVLGSSSYLIQK